MKVAIVGAGISGLTAAYRLHPRHDVVVFEAGSYPGGHTNTVTVDDDGVERAIDTGFIVFNDRTYPNFIRLLDELGVASRPTSMSFSVRDDRTGLEYNGHSLDTLFAQRRNLANPSFYRMLLDVLRFNREARLRMRETDDETTVEQFLNERRYSREFCDHYLLPMGSAVWSCPMGKFARFPIRFVVEFYHHHGLLDIFNRPQWRTIAGGSREYVKAMTRGFADRVRLNSPITSIHRLRDRVVLRWGAGLSEAFDHVVFACHSDQALRVLGDQATVAEREVLGAFPYERNTAVLHTDDSLLPKTRRAWACWNYRTTRERGSPATVTYNMNMLQGIESKRTFCVTLNADDSIRPERVIQSFVYHHPVFTPQRAAARARRDELLMVNRTSYCGAYWRNGFHEDGVVSALEVVDAIDTLEEMPHLHRTAPSVRLGAPVRDAELSR